MRTYLPKNVEGVLRSIFVEIVLEASLNEFLWVLGLNR